MDLAIVIPVYNEEKTIQVLIQDLYKILINERIDYTMFIINDGSTDSSQLLIEKLSMDIPNIQLLSKANSGHGPSLLEGYRAASGYNWIFQFDSDYQYSLTSFKELWEVREQYDLLVAERMARSASLARHGVTVILSYLVRSVFGKGIKDINVPYRLIRGNQLKRALLVIGVNRFAPNMLITAFFVKHRLRIFSTTSEFRGNVSTRQSKLTLSIFNGCVKSIFDLMIFRFKV